MIPGMSPTAALPARVGCGLLVAALLLSAPVAIAARTAPQPTTSGTVEVTRPAYPAQLFDDLEALEDPALAEQTASGLSNTELILVIIFLIILFPVGIILLIIFLVD